MRRLKFLKWLPAALLGPMGLVSGHAMSTAAVRWLCRRNCGGCFRSIARFPSPDRRLRHCAKGANAHSATQSGSWRTCAERWVRTVGSLMPSLSVIRPPRRARTLHRAHSTKHGCQGGADRRGIKSCFGSQNQILKILPSNSFDRDAGFGLWNGPPSQVGHRPICLTGLRPRQQQTQREPESSNRRQDPWRCVPPEILDTQPQRQRPKKLAQVACLLKQAVSACKLHWQACELLGR